MKKVSRIAYAASIALLVAACSPGDDDRNEAAEANAQADMNAMAADPNNPYAQVEAQMHQAMMAATGADPSETWIRKMIEHHRGAVAMADIVLAQNPTPEVRDRATRSREEQLREIERLEAMLVPEPAAQPSAGGAGPPSTPASSEPAAAPRSRDADSSPPKPAPKRTPPPTTADPHAGHDMNTMNTTNKM